MPGTRILVGGLLFAVFVVAVFVVFLLATSKDHRIIEGAGYGFVIGESPKQSYRRAIDLQSEGAFEEFRLGHGSAAFLLEPSKHNPVGYSKWQLVVDPDWWNNTIYLTFENSRLVEIWRFRAFFEMP